MSRHLSPRHGQVILVSGCPVLTAVNWSQHWCPICVHYQFSCVESIRWSWSSKTINWSADSFQINHDELTYEPAIWSCDTGQWLSCFDSCQLTILWMSNIRDVDLPRHSLPFDSLPYSTRTIYRQVRTRWPYSMSMGLCAWEPRKKGQTKLKIVASRDKQHCESYASFMSTRIQICLTTENFFSVFEKIRVHTQLMPIVFALPHEMI